MVDWRSLAAKVDAVVDQTWGVRVEIVPIKRSEYEAGVVDPDRARARSPAVLIMDTGEQPAEPTGFRSRMVEGTIRFSISSAPLDAVDVRQGDRINILNDDDSISEAFEVDRTLPDGTGRSTVYVNRAAEE